MARHKVLVIEDEQALLDVLAYNLQREGYDVLTAADGRLGLEQAERELPDVVVLDLMLPGIDGLEVCRQLRANPRTQSVVILMLTARTEEVDEMVGFSLGADDYVAKPYKMKPLLHRIKALLRRKEPAEAAADVIRAHGIEIDRVHYRVTVGGAELPLTPTEFRLLLTLARHPGRPYSRFELLDAVRGEDANALERTIDVHVRALRQKLGARADVIETVRGIGYRFRPA